MNLTLARQDARSDGIFSLLQGDGGKIIAWTLERAHPRDSGGYAPKIPAGTYRCVRGIHHLERVKGPVETFEITGVPGHTGVLFHVGNFNNDSEGCVLLGQSIAKDVGPWMLSQSRKAFLAFMQLQSGLPEFPLTVLG